MNAAPLYPLTWITPSLAVGHAPMSHAELDAIRDQGIGAILNLCGEFSDLHQIEAEHGFEVYFLPVPDECAPDMNALEDALDWLDETVYLGKKVLVHCRHGHGRTGTVVAAYLLRRGLGLKPAEKTLRGTRAQPTNYAQWKLLRDFQKKEGVLRAARPRLENRQAPDLEPFVREYEAIAERVAAAAARAGAPELGQDTCQACHAAFQVRLADAVHVQQGLARDLDRQRRRAVIERAAGAAALLERDPAARPPCPLLDPEGGPAPCLLPRHRPLRCRMHGLDPGDPDREMYENMCAALSRNVFLTLTGTFPPDLPLLFSFASAVSGRFVQQAFHFMLAREGGHG